MPLVAIFGVVVLLLSITASQLSPTLGMSWPSSKSMAVLTRLVLLLTLAPVTHAAWTHGLASHGGALSRRSAVHASAAPAALDAQRGVEAKKRVLILISDTGGGHRASAQAVEAAMNEQQHDLDISVVDLWTTHTPFPYNMFVPGYKFAAKNPLVWSAVYFSTEYKPFYSLLNCQGTLICYNGIRKCIEQYAPDLVVSMHPLCQDIPLKVLGDLAKESEAPRIPFATVVTDLGSAHPTWFHPGVDACFIPSDAVQDVALGSGVAAGQLRQYGLPVRKDFYAEPDVTREALAEQLGVANGRKTVLVVGGGDGVGSLEDIVGTLATRLGESCRDQAQLVVVCGKNDELRRQLESRSYDGVRVHVEGFVSNMPQWMAVADCLVTKAGPGTIAEAAIQGLPCMLFFHLPGQEAGNVPFVVDGGFGEYSEEPEVIAQTVCTWLQQPSLLEQMKQRALEAAAPQATQQIAQDLLAMI